MEVEGQDISTFIPSEFSRTDFESLEKAGLLTKIGEWKNPNDEWEGARECGSSVRLGISSSCALKWRRGVGEGRIAGLGAKGPIRWRLGHFGFCGVGCCSE